MVLSLLLIQSLLLNQRKRRLYNKVKVFLALHALRAQNLCGDHVLGNTLELREWFVLLIFKALYELWYARFFLMIFPKAICINYFYAANVVTVSFPPSYQMVCSDKSQFSCENLCGNPLPCANHYCTKTCHALENQLQGSEPCEDCYLPCQKVLNLL